jgi:hypothetical protein
MAVVLPREVVETMARRSHRLHHWLWHEVRDNWLRYPEDVRKQVSALGWEPPRPALDERGRPVFDNDAGEDFFYLHRQMLVRVSTILARVRDPEYPRVLVWPVPPPPDDTRFPVPPAWFDPTAGEDRAQRHALDDALRWVKSDDFHAERLLPWHRTFSDPGYLRRISLGTLGSLIERTVHAGLSLRWAAAPGGRRPDPGPAADHTIDPRWDDPRYDFLGDPYASHVNATFWSLHGWIDDRLEDWKVANGVYGNGFWKGTWVGRMPPIDPEPAVGGQSGDDGGAQLEELLAVIGRSGIFRPRYAVTATSIGGSP